MVRWRGPVVAAGVLVFLLVGAWAGGSSLYLRSAQVKAFHAMQSVTAAKSAPSAPIQQARASATPRPVAVKSAGTGATATTTCQGQMTLVGFDQAPSLTSGSVRIAWSVSDHCPPYHGYIQGAYLLSDGGLRIVQHPIRDPSGTLYDYYDCSSTPHWVGIKYQLNLWDSANRLAFAQTAVNVC